MPDTHGTAPSRRGWRPAVCYCCWHRSCFAEWWCWQQDAYLQQQKALEEQTGATAAAALIRVRCSWVGTGESAVCILVCLAWQRHILCLQRVEGPPGLCMSLRLAHGCRRHCRPRMDGPTSGCPAQHAELLSSFRTCQGPHSSSSSSCRRSRHRGASSSSSSTLPWPS